MIVTTNWRIGWIRSIAHWRHMPTDDPVLLALTDAQRTYQIPIGLLDQLAFGTAADLDYGSSETSCRRATGRALPDF